MSEINSTAMVFLNGAPDAEFTVARRGRDNWAIGQVEKLLGRKDFYLRSNKQGGLNIVDLPTGHRIGALYWVN